VDIVILQHYRESDHAKNTVRLVQLALADVDVQVVQPGSNLVQAVNVQDDERCAVFFPTADSRPLEKNLSSFSANDYRKVVFLDGSWKQASGMAHRLSKNHHMHFFHFENPQPSRYQIRHTTQAFGLSTIEAVALVLEKAASVDTRPLTELLEGFQNHWRSPAWHRREQ
jgi:DTW domain-containing protein YfiP